MSHLDNIHIFIGPLKGDLPDPVYLLPVTPEVISITDSSNLNRSRVIGIGEIAQVGSHNLKRFTIASFFPKFYETYTSEHFPVAIKGERLGLTVEQQFTWYDPKPLVWVDRFKAMRDIPLKIVISGINVDENYIMNSFTWSAVGGQGEDIDYVANFVQYKELSIRVVDFGNAGQPIQIATFPPYIRGDTIYVVIPGDTWASIGQKTGLPPEFIMRINNLRNVFFLKPGIVLQLRQKTTRIPGDTITPPD